MENEENREVELDEQNDNPNEDLDNQPKEDLSDIRERLERLEKLEKENASLKREVKKATKTKSSEEKPDDTLLQKAFLRSADIVSEDEVDLALETARKWGVTVDKLVDDEDFKVKLERLRTSKANIEATTNVRGDGNKSNTKNTPEYWIAKGVPPTKEDIPDSVTRRKINVAFATAHKGGANKKFYND